MLLMYADSSDEDEKEEDSQGLAYEIDEVFSNMTNPGHRHDSLKEIVLLKDTKAASFNEKQRSKGPAVVLGTT